MMFTLSNLSQKELAAKLGCAYMEISNMTAQWEYDRTSTLYVILFASKLVLIRIHIMNCFVLY